MATVKCPKCGAPNELDVGRKLMRCAYCNSENYIDRSGAAFVYVLPFKLDDAGAQGTFRRWTAGSDKAKDLEATARVVQMKRAFFPVFMFRRDTDRGEQVLVQPARSTTLPGLHSLKVPAGDIKVYDSKFDVGTAEVNQPDIDMMAYLPTLPGKAKEQAMVFFPLYSVKYTYGPAQYDVVIDGSTGEVSAASWPPRAAGAYIGAGVGGFVACAVEGFLIVSVSAIAGAVALLVTIPVLVLLFHKIAKER